jgi:endogenous inhibitor of DNA gyrase (YacG/DUF329 family)
MKVRCPTCGRLTSWKDNAFRPFCCERCRLLDLGSWLGEKFVISSPMEDESERDDPPDEIES